MYSVLLARRALSGVFRLPACAESTGGKLARAQHRLVSLSESDFIPDEILCSEFKLRGSPWWASTWPSVVFSFSSLTLSYLLGGGEAVTARIYLLGFLEILENNGYSVYASVDQNMGVSRAFVHPALQLMLIYLQKRGSNNSVGSGSSQSSWPNLQSVFACRRGQVERIPGSVAGRGTGSPGMLFMPPLYNNYILVTS